MLHCGEFLWTAGKSRAVSYILTAHKLGSFAMNLIKVLLGNLAPTQLFAMSQRDYSDPGFEPLPNHEKKLSRHVKFCFSCCSRSVNKLLYPGLWWGAGPRRGQERHADAISEILHMSTQLKRCRIPSVFRGRRTAAADWWKMSPNRAPAINQCIPDFWATELQQAVLPCLHVWAKAVFTLDNQQRARGPTERRRRRRKKKYVQLIKDWHKKGSLSFPATAPFFLSGKSPLTALVWHPIKTHFICGKNNIKYMSLAYKNGAGDKLLL